MVPVNAISITTRAVIAGFAKLQPSPPKRHFTMMIAMKEPTTACQIGRVAGTFIARRRPVTTAEK